MNGTNGKQSDFPDVALVPYPVIVAATKGDPDAMKIVLQHFSGYILNDPKILILDEPTAGLDPSERIRFRNLISELSADRIVLLSTHIVSDVEFMAGQIILMKKGRFVATGTTDELIQKCPDRSWICSVPKNQVDSYCMKYRVANVKTLADHAKLRILSENMPIPGAVSEETTLEDVFLSYFGERSGDESANGMV